MSNFDEGNAFIGDVTSSVCTLMCRYYETTKDYIHECQSMMKVLLICMMLVLVSIFCCEGITKQQKI